MKIEILTCQPEVFQRKLESLIKLGWEPKFESYNCFVYDINAYGTFLVNKCSIILVKK